MESRWVGHDFATNNNNNILHMETAYLSMPSLSDIYRHLQTYHSQPHNYISSHTSLLCTRTSSHFAQSAKCIWKPHQVCVLACPLNKRWEGMDNTDMQQILNQQTVLHTFDLRVCH